LASLRLPRLATRQLVACWITGAVVIALLWLAYGRWEHHHQANAKAMIDLWQQNATMGLTMQGADAGTLAIRDSAAARARSAQALAFSHMGALERGWRTYRPAAQVATALIVVVLVVLTWAWARPLTRSVDHDSAA
jgi:hypothetical protein